MHTTAIGLAGGALILPTTGDELRAGLHDLEAWLAVVLAADWVTS